MEVVVNLIYFLLGMAVGAGTFIAYGVYQVRKFRKIKDALWEEIKKKATEAQTKTTTELNEKGISIKERLVKASQIAQTQMELRSQAEMPSKNALHSRYKNGLAAEINELEQQKLDILRTILAEGYNPVITVVHDGGRREEVPLSDYIGAAQADVDKYNGGPTPPPPPANAEGNEPKKVGKFFIYKGGKDDGTTH